MTKNFSSGLIYGGDCLYLLKQEFLKLVLLALNNIFVFDQASDPVNLVGMNQIMLVKSLLVARDTLLEELQRLSKAVDRVIDLTDFMSKMNNMNMLDSILRADLDNAYGEVREQGGLQDGLKVLSSFA